MLKQSKAAVDVVRITLPPHAISSTAGASAHTSAPRWLGIGLSVYLCPAQWGLQKQISAVITMLLSLAHIHARDSSFSDFLSIASFLENLEASQHSSPFLCQPALQGKELKWLNSLLWEFLFYFWKSVKKYVEILDNNTSFLVYCPKAKLSIAKDLPHVHQLLTSVAISFVIELVLYSS